MGLIISKQCVIVIMHFYEEKVILRGFHFKARNSSITIFFIGVIAEYFAFLLIGYNFL